MGAINAVALGCGLRPEQLISLWKTISIGTVMRYRFFRAMMDFFLNRLSPIADPTPLERFLNDNLNFDVLRSNHTQVYITATNILNGELEIFSNQEITVNTFWHQQPFQWFFPGRR